MQVHVEVQDGGEHEPGSVVARPGLSLAQFRCGTWVRFTRWIEIAYILVLSM